MIVEPVSTSARGPLRRVAGALGVMLPVALLAFVVAGGLLGRAEDDGPGTADATRGPRASGPLATVPSGTPPPSVPAVRVAEQASVPRAIDGLQVHDVATTLALRALGTGGVVAVAGYLSLAEIPASCADRILGPSGALCRREGVVVDDRATPWTPSRVARAPLGPSLHPVFPPGVRMPPEVARTTVDGDGPPLPVVLLGRFDDPRAAPCPPTGRECPHTFIVSGVIWFDGSLWHRPTVLEPTLDFDVSDDPWPEQRAAARDALGDVDRVLVIALVGPATLTTIDPVAAAALADPAPARLWYVLGLEVEPVPGSSEALGRTRWVVVDNATGGLIAAGDDVTATGGDIVPAGDAGSLQAG